MQNFYANKLIKSATEKILNSDKKICIYGSGGFGREILCCLIDMLQGKEIVIKDKVVFMLSDNLYSAEEVMGISVIKESNFDKNAYQVIVGVGDPFARKSIVEKLPTDTEYITVIHPSAVISDWVEIGDGSIITAGCILTCNIKIGKHAHINLHTTIGHDCNMQDYFTTAPATNISGNCNFGNCVYFGTNASIKQGIEICDNVTIGMGGVVTKNIAEEGIYIGNPLKKFEKK